MAEFFAMGGYGFHVWSTWGISFILLGGLLIVRKRRLQRLQSLAKSEPMSDQTHEPPN